MRLMPTRRTTWLRIVPVLAVALATAAAWPAGTASAGDVPSKRYRDKNYKFSVRMFDGWDPVPLESKGSRGFEDALSTYAAAKFTQKGAQERGFRNSLLEFYRIAADMKPETTPSDTPGSMMRPFGGEPKSMTELLARALERYGFTVILDPMAGKVIKSRDDVPGSYWVVDKTAKTKGARDPMSSESTYMVAATWKKDNVEVGMWALCEGPLKKKFESGFKAVVDSFTWFDDKAEDVESKSVLDGMRITAKKRREIEKGLVRGWDVIVSPKKNYIIVYNTNKTRNNQLAKIIAERIEKIREQFYETQFPPAAPVLSVSLVRVCGDATEYHAYGGPGGSAGYWSDDTEELVFYDMSPKKEPDDNTLSVLYHEAFHQFIYYSVGKVAPHSWFNEGHGDYYAGSKLAGNTFKIHPFAWRVPVIKDAIRKGAIACEEVKGDDGSTERIRIDPSGEGYVPLNIIVKMSQGDYYGYANVCYAEGWSLVYFLREIVPKNDKWNAKWGKILETYFATLKAEVNKESPLAPPVVKPDTTPTTPTGPGMEEPGTDEPGMDEPGMDEGGMDEGGMDDPGMDEPGMDDPGMGDDPKPPPPSGPPPDGEGAPAIARFLSRYANSGKALRAAVEAAFKGVDFEELEKAWSSSIAKLSSR